MNLQLACTDAWCAMHTHGVIGRGPIFVRKLCLYGYPPAALINIIWPYGAIICFCTSATGVEGSTCAHDHIFFLGLTSLALRPLPGSSACQGMLGRKSNLEVWISSQFEFERRPLARTRHHCRLCGSIFCGACSAGKLLLPPKFREASPQRVCVNCAALLTPLQPFLAGARTCRHLTLVPPCSAYHQHQLHLGRAGNRRAFDKLGMRSSSLLSQDWMDLWTLIYLFNVSLCLALSLSWTLTLRERIFFGSRVPPSVVY